MTITDPWFSHWNHALLELLFRCIPHTQTVDDRFGDLISNPFLGTWIFAAFFYWFWIRDDDKREQRRAVLFRTIVAMSAAILVTLILRPLVRWPAPALSPGFEALFPRYLWGQGSRNCFPSHSTLVYFTVAAGLWSLNRGLSIGLSVLALVCISLPRVYLGGHYPIDILFSCLLGICALLAVSRWRMSPAIADWLLRRGSGTALRDWLLFLWVFELGEGFRGTEFILAAVRQLMKAS